MTLPMVGLITCTLWLINYRVSEQVYRDVAHALHASRSAFLYARDMRARHLMTRCRNVPHDPRFKATAQLAEPETLRFMLSDS